MKYCDKLQSLTGSKGIFYMPTPDKPYFTFIVSKTNQRDTIAEVGEDYVLVDYEFGSQIVPLNLFVLEA